METIQVTSNFKSVANPKSAHYGAKRNSLTWTFQGYKPHEIAEINSEHAAIIINDALASYGKKLLADNSEDWTYIPSGVTIAALAEEIERETTRSRIITKESLSKLSAIYGVVMATVPGMPTAGIKGAQSIIESNFKNVSGNTEVLKKMAERLIEMEEHAQNFPQDNQYYQAVTNYMGDNGGVFSAVLNRLADLIDESQSTVDANAI